MPSNMAPRRHRRFLLLTVFGYLLLSTVCGYEWFLNTEYSYYRTVRVNSVQLSTPPVHTRTCKSEIHCAWICWSHDSKSYHFDDSDSTCKCFTVLPPHTEEQTDFGTYEISYGRYIAVKKSFKDHHVKFDIQPGRLDCLEILQDNFQQNGVYVIAVNVDVWCDMEGGGWTVIQRRKDGSENFFRDWNNYRAGFGDTTGEYWLGLNHMHVLTMEPSKLYITLKTFGDRDPVTTRVEYASFSVGNEASSFKLSTSGYTGCGSNDALATSNGMGFSTYDVDNDNHPTASCAWSYHGAWWFNNCHGCHLNGDYYQNPELASDNTARGISWVPCYTGLYSLKESEMKVMRNIGKNSTLDNMFEIGGALF